MISPNEIRAYSSAALSSTKPGLSGASVIGIPDDIDGATATNLENALRELYAAGGGVATVSGLGTVKVSVDPADPNSPVAIEVSEKGAANGVATLKSGKVPATQLRKVDTGTGLKGGGDLSRDRTLALTDTAVTPGTYARATVTVDKQGRITSVAEGAAGSIADASETERGAVEHATEAEIQAGTVGNLVATVARLKAELDRREELPAATIPTLTNGWVAHGGALLGPGYYKDRRGFVFLEGSIKDGGVGGGTGPFTLPGGYRPPGDVYFGVDSAGSLPGKVRILSTGAVEVVQPTENVRVSLNGIFFRAAA